MQKPALGSEQKPIQFRVQTESRLHEIAHECENQDWIFIGEISPILPEDISEFEYMQNPSLFEKPPRMKIEGIKKISQRNETGKK